MRAKSLIRLCLLGTISVLATPSAWAQSAPALTVTGQPELLGNPPFTIGFQFTLSRTFSVTGLGVFDEGGDGFVAAHQVGLWDASGTLLRSTILGAGTSGTLTDGFRYGSITPATLGVGTYQIGALFTDGGDALFFPNSGAVTTIAGVTYVSGAFSEGATLRNPDVIGTEAPSYIGPNLLLEAAADPVGAVPEPSTWAMMIAGFGMVGGALRRRPRVRNVSVRFG